MSIKKINGKLIYNDNAEYEIHTHRGIVHNLSTLLNRVLQFDNKYIEITIMNGCKILFNEQGNLNIRPSLDNNANGICGYHIDIYDLGTVLFNNTFIDLEITIFAAALEGVKHHGSTQNISDF